MAKGLIGLCLFFSSVLFAQENLQIAVASNFKPTLEKLVALFKAENSGIDISLSSASTGVLYAQISQGAPFDMFFSADDSSAKKLQQEGLVLNGYRAVYAQGKLILWTPNFSDFDIALDAMCKQPVVIANPKVAPYGKAAQSFIESLNLSCELSLIKANNVAHAFQLVSLGHASVGLLPLSLLQLDSPQRKNFWELEKGSYPSIDQAMVILSRTRHAEQALRFYRFVLSPQAQELIAGSGYFSVVN